MQRMRTWGLGYSGVTGVSAATAAVLPSHRTKLAEKQAR